MTPETLKTINDRLASQGVRVSIEVKGKKLCLRGTLPPRPGKGDRPYQQRIYLGVGFTPAGLKRAEAEARKISALLDCKEFEWPAEPEEPEATEPEAAAAAIEKFHQDYLDRGGKQSTWDTEYKRVLRKLDKPPTADSLLELLKATPPNTRTRIRAYQAISALAKFMNIPIDLKPYKGTYSSYTTLSSRTIPTDAQILEAYELLSKKWRWVYGMMATYGLRNHEIFHLQLDFPRISIGQHTKTGAREVWPCPPEWIERFQLDRPVLPDVNPNQPNQKLGQRVFVAFQRAGTPFNPYDLRHAWAIRTLEWLWPVEFSAQMMGHSVEVHTKIYQRWITREKKQQIFETLTQLRNGKV